MINKTINLIIILLIGLIPVFFLPITANFYAFNKNFLLVLTAALLCFLWAVKILVERKIEISRSDFDWPIIALALAFVFATIFASTNKIEALLFPSGTGTILALALLYFLITNTMKEQKLLLTTMVVSACLLSLIAIYQFIGLGESLLPETSSWRFLKLKNWTPTGATISLISYLFLSLAITLPWGWRKRESINKIALFLASALITVGLIISVYQWWINKDNNFDFLPWKSGWAIAIEAFKQNPLFGVGPAQFISAFNRYRPVSFNQYQFWNLRFTASSNYPLQILTITGIIGFLALTWLIIKMIRRLGQKRKSFYNLPLIVVLLELILLPPNFLLLFFAVVLLALSSTQKVSLAVPLHKNLRWILLGISILLLATTFYFGGRAYLAEIHFKKSLDALAKNQGATVYNEQIKAINLNPKRTDFRITYSQTNLALANALASRQDISDQDKQKISQLIQQAIREAKIATVLNPNDARTWENLAQLYRNLINFAQGADQWAIAAYRQAIINDPVNPRIRLNLGGLYYVLGNYEQAVQLFQQAVNLKPDYANGYYNLAAAYREQKKYQEAYQAMQVVVNLVPFDSADYQKAQAELKDLAEKLPSKEVSPSAQPATQKEETLTKPAPLPTPATQITPIVLPNPEEATSSPQPLTP